MYSMVKYLKWLLQVFMSDIRLHGICITNLVKWRVLHSQANVINNQNSQHLERWSGNDDSATLHYETKRIRLYIFSQKHFILNSNTCRDWAFTASYFTLKPAGYSWSYKTLLKSSVNVCIFNTLFCFMSTDSSSQNLSEMPRFCV